MSQRRPLTPAQLRRVEFHEAGHAVAAVLLGIPIRYATVERDHHTLGHVRERQWTQKQRDHVQLGRSWFGDDIGHRRFVERQVILTLAGAVAEVQVCGRRPRRRPKILTSDDLTDPTITSDEEFERAAAEVKEHGWAPPDDEEIALEVARSICETDKEAEALVAYLRERTRNMVRNRFFQAEVRAVAEELHRRPRIGARTLRRIVHEAGARELQPRSAGITQSGATAGYIDEKGEQT